MKTHHFILLSASPRFFDTQEEYDSFASLPFEKGQTSLASKFGHVDVHKTTRHDGRWTIFGWYTPKAAAP